MDPHVIRIHIVRALFLKLWAYQWTRLSVQYELAGEQEQIFWKQQSLLKICWILRNNWYLNNKEAKLLSAKVTEISHNHLEGMKGAEAIATEVYLARNGKSKEEIRDYITANYYVIDFSLDQIRKSYRIDVSCQGSVPVYSLKILKTP